MKLLALAYMSVGWMPILVLIASPYPWYLLGAALMIFYWVAVEEVRRGE
jgi:hypothetical protein